MSGNGFLGFVPETYILEFETWRGKIVNTFFEVWGFSVHKGTFRESIANLALASGLRFTGSMSLSYSKRRILDIINNKEGFTQETVDGCLGHSIDGWEMRALQELQYFGMCHYRRIIFIMLFKLSLQVNVQISCFVITRINLKRQHEGDSWEMTKIVVRAVFVCMIMLYTFFTELYDVWGFLDIFKQVKNAKTGEKQTVEGKWEKQTIEGKSVDLRDSNKIYAIQQFWETQKTQDTKEKDKILLTCEYTGKQLRQDFLAAKRIWYKIIFLTVLCVGMFFYALLKFAMSFLICQSGAWQLASNCLNLPEL